MKKEFLWLVILMSLALNYHSVGQQRGCGAQLYRDKKIANNPNYNLYLEEQEKLVRERLSSTNKSAWTGGGIGKIPVVVHLIGDNVISACSSSSYARVLQQIEVLNNDYRKKVGTNGFGNGFDTQIEFCLASVDPNGSPTAGITLHPDIIGDEYPLMWRPFANDPGRDNNRIKNIEHWNPEKYLNIYVVNDMEFWDPRYQQWFGLLGYATWPDDLYLNPDDDGVVVSVNVFGITNHPVYNLGRTTTHEVGHWLNLKHVWGDGDEDCSFDDDVDDTPICEYSSPNGKISSSCAPIRQCEIENQIKGLSDFRPIENYMDYSDDGCMNAFSLGQVQRMQDALINYRRNIIYNSHELVECSLAEHCTNGIKDADETGVDCGGINCEPCGYSGYTYGRCSGGASFHDPLFINGSDDEFVIVCDKSPAWGFECLPSGMNLPDKHQRTDKGAECSSVCESGSIFGKPKCSYQPIFFSIQKADFDKTVIGTEYFRYYDATDGCIFPDYAIDMPYYNGLSLSLKLTTLTGPLGVSIEDNVFYKVKFAGHYNNGGWVETAAYFYPVGDQFEPDINYSLSKGFGKEIIIANPLTKNISQDYYANEYIEFNPGAEIDVNGLDTYKSFQITTVSCRKGFGTRSGIAGDEFKSLSDPNSSFVFASDEADLVVYPNPISAGSGYINTQKKIQHIAISSLDEKVQDVAVDFNYIDKDEVEIIIPDFLSNGIYYVRIIYLNQSEAYEKIVLLR